jgi:hypothetical protein
MGTGIPNNKSIVQGTLYENHAYESRAAFIALLVSDCIWGVSASPQDSIRRIGILQVPDGQPGWVQHVQGRARCPGDDGRWGCILQRMQPSIISPISGSQSVGICTSYLTRTEPESPSMLYK